MACNISQQANGLCAASTADGVVFHPPQDAISPGVFFTCMPAGLIVCCGNIMWLDFTSLLTFRRTSHHSSGDEDELIIHT